MTVGYPVGYRDEEEEFGTEKYTVDELIKNDKCPLPLETIPNNMGINLCSVDTIEWDKQKDGQLTYLRINFIPSKD